MYFGNASQSIFAENAALIYSSIVCVTV